MLCCVATKAWLLLHTEVKSEVEAVREVAGSTEMLNIPSPIPEVDEALREELALVCNEV